MAFETALSLQSSSSGSSGRYFSGFAIAFILSFHRGKLNLKASSAHSCDIAANYYCSCPKFLSDLRRVKAFPNQGKNFSFRSATSGGDVLPPRYAHEFFLTTCSGVAFATTTRFIFGSQTYSVDMLVWPVGMCETFPAAIAASIIPRSTLVILSIAVTFSYSQKTGLSTFRSWVSACSHAQMPTTWICEVALPTCASTAATRASSASNFSLNTEMILSAPASVAD